jgi:hypothetical protein
LTNTACTGLASIKDSATLDAKCPPGGSSGGTDAGGGGNTTDGARSCPGPNGTTGQDISCTCTDGTQAVGCYTASSDACGGACSTGKCDKTKCALGCNFPDVCK